MLCLVFQRTPQGVSLLVKLGTKKAVYEKNVVLNNTNKKDWCALSLVLMAESGVWKVTFCPPLTDQTVTVVTEGISSDTPTGAESQSRGYSMAEVGVDRNEPSGGSTFFFTKRPLEVVDRKEPSGGTASADISPPEGDQPSYRFGVTVPEADGISDPNLERVPRKCASVFLGSVVLRSLATTTTRNDIGLPLVIVAPLVRF